MSVRVATHRPWRGRLTLSLASVAAVGLALTGCGTSEPEASAPATSSTSAPASSSASTSTSSSAADSGTTSGRPSDDGNAAAADLPGVPLERSGYEGDPRPIGEVYHLACLEALAGDAQVPDTEGTGQDEDGELSITPWSTQSGQALTEGWAYCPTETGGGMAIPSTFEVTPDPANEEGGALNGLTIADSTGQQVGGFRADVSGGAPKGAEVVGVLDVTEQPDYTGALEETVYLRSLVVEAGSGTQLMVDLVSVPEGTDPETLEAWDLAIHDGDHRVVVYGTIPLDSADGAEEAADSALHEVLREMVGSYQPAVQ